MTTNPAQSSQIPSLDGFRALAILIVFAGHVRLHPGIPGGFGVTVFFFLSGFLITSLLLREYDRYGTIAFGAFFARRVVRLAPPLLVTLLGAALLVMAGLAEGNLSIPTFLSQIFFYYNYYAIYGDGDNTVRGLGILWSLSVEEHFYLIWPFLFLLIARNRLGVRHLVGLLIAILLWRWFRFYVWLDTEWVIYALTDTRFDSLLYGCLLAILQARSTAGRIFPDRPGPRVFLLAGAVMILLVTLFFRDPTFRSTLRYSLQGLALMPVFHYAVTRPDLLVFRPLNHSVVRWVGVMSYTFYICHYVILEALVLQGLDQTSYPLFFVLSAGLALLWSAVVFYGVERPLKPLRARLTGHGVPTGGRAAP